MRLAATPHERARTGRSTAMHWPAPYRVSLGRRDWPSGRIASFPEALYRGAIGTAERGGKSAGATTFRVPPYGPTPARHEIQPALRRDPRRDPNV